MEKSEFHRVYSSWFDNWEREYSDNIYCKLREFIVENEIYINVNLPKSRKNRDDRPEIKRIPDYKSFQI